LVVHIKKIIIIENILKLKKLKKLKKLLILLSLSLRIIHQLKLSEKEEKFKEQIKGGMDEQTLQNFVVENNVSNENLQNIIESFKKELFSNS